MSYIGNYNLGQIVTAFAVELDAKPQDVLQSLLSLPLSEIKFMASQPTSALQLKRIFGPENPTWNEYLKAGWMDAEGNLKRERGQRHIFIAGRAR